MWASQNVFETVLFLFFYYILHLGEFKMATCQSTVKTLLGEPKSVLAREGLEAYHGGWGVPQDHPLGLQEPFQAPQKQPGQKQKA